MNSINAIVIAAQDVEIRPFLDILQGKGPAAATLQAARTHDDAVPLIGSVRKTEKIPAPVGSGWLMHTPSGRILAMRTGIGLVATASALGWALTRYSPRCVMSIGSAGGLANSARVLDVVAGASYSYGTADATAFGYARGQVPGQPAVFACDQNLLAHIGENVRTGLMLTGDSFVTARNVGDMREAFPEALTTDMESTAAAQTCVSWSVPFLSIRCVSDLCGPSADQDYHVAIEDASAASAIAAIQTLENYIEQPIGRAPLFGRTAIKAALLLILAISLQLEPSANLDMLSEGIEEETRRQLAGNPEYVDTALGLIASAQETIANHPDVSITAKRYDAVRGELIASLARPPGRGQIFWPPTSQTVSKRSNGYWNDALAQVGMKVKTGRRRGTTKFTDDDYYDALHTFTTWAERVGMKPTVTSYARWLNEGFAGETRPSSAAIRQRFGTWRAALTIISK